MRITFLGTAAATSFPLTFCRCKNCEDARKYKGKSIRKRSSLLIDDKILIDMGPDFITSLNLCGKNITKIKYLLQTHPHSDHFDEDFENYHYAFLSSSFESCESAISL